MVFESKKTFRKLILKNYVWLRLYLFISKDTLPSSYMSISSFCLVHTPKIILGLNYLSVLDSLDLQCKGYTVTLKTSRRSYCSHYAHMIKKVCLENKRGLYFFLFYKLRMCLTESTHSQIYHHLTKPAAGMQRHETDNGHEQFYKSFYMKKD